MLSVIIPALNEADTIGRLLEQLNRQTGIVLEVIVVDGGSQDGTTTIVRNAGVLLIDSAPGRGLQMNRGFESASHDLLLFLHADSRLTDDHQLSEALKAFLAEPDRVAGHFAMTFDTTNPDVRLTLRFFEEKTRLNRPGTFNGDQGLMIRRLDFKLLGGFSEQRRFLEDQEFGYRFSEWGRFITLPGRIITSARRFEQEGAGERILLNTLIMGMFHLESDTFFEDAPGIYRESSAAGLLRPGPFFSLAQRSVFDRGLLTGLVRCYRIGRFATRNLWQAGLWLGLKTGDPDRMLQRYDRYVAPVVKNPVGYLLGTLTVISWFYCLKLYYGRGRR